MICPFSSDWNERIVSKIYPDKIDPFLKVIKKETIESGVVDVNDYIKESKWKRRSGCKSNYSGDSRIDFIEQNNDLKIIFTNPNEKIPEWLKVFGPYLQLRTENMISGEIKFKEVVCSFNIENLLIKIIRR